MTAINRAHLKNGPWATNGGYEYNVVLIAAVLALTETGPGSPSVDAALGSERQGPKWAAWALLAGVAGAAAAHAIAEATDAPEPAAEPETEADSQGEAARGRGDHGRFLDCRPDVSVHRDAGDHERRPPTARLGSGICPSTTTPTTTAVAGNRATISEYVDRGSRAIASWSVTYGITDDEIPTPTPASSTSGVAEHREHLPPAGRRDQHERDQHRGTESAQPAHRPMA